MADLNYKKILNDLEISEKDLKNIENLSFLIERYIDDIVNEVVEVISKDDDIVKVIMDANLPIDTAKRVWAEIFRFVFSSKKDDYFFLRLKKIGRIHAKKGVNESFFMSALYTFNNHIINKLKRYNYITFENFVSINKLFGLIAIVVLSSYVEEKEARNKALIKTLGIKDKLLERLISVGRKNRI